MTIGKAALEAFVEDLVALEFEPRDEALARAAARWVGECTVGAAAVARCGLLAPAVILDITAVARYSRRFAALDRTRRLRMTARLADTRLSPTANWVRAVRLLAVVYVFERRFG